MHLLSLFFTKVNRKYLVPSLDISACCRKMEASSIRFQVSILRYFCYRKFSNLSTLFAVKKEGDIAFLDLHITDFRKHQKMNFIILYVKSCSIYEPHKYLCKVQAYRWFFDAYPRRSYGCTYAKSRREASGTYMAHNGQCRTDIVRGDSNHHCSDYDYDQDLNSSGKLRRSLAVDRSRTPLDASLNPEQSMRALHRSARRLNIVNETHEKAFYTREFQMANRTESQNIKLKFYINICNI